MEQVIFILIALVIGVFNWMSKRQQDAGSIFSEEDSRSEPKSEFEMEQERMRKFMEALGMPSGSAPPPRVEQRRIQKRPAPSAQVQGPPQRQPRSTPIPQTPPVTPQPAPAPLPVIAVKPEPEAGRYEVDLHEQASLKQVAEIEKQPGAISMNGKVNLASVSALLRQPTSLRTAFILKEVLGPPRALDASTGF